MIPFLESVTSYLFEHYRNNLENMSVVFPNKRARLFFNQYLASHTEQPLLAPKYFTINEYMHQVSGTTLADPITLLFLIYEVYTKKTGSKESFDDFLYYGEMMLADFDDIDKYRIDANALFKKISQFKEIDSFADFLDEAQIEAIRMFWENFRAGELSEQKQIFSQIWNQLNGIYVAFTQKLSAVGLSYEGMACRQAIERIENNTYSFAEEKIVFLGFNALNNCEKALFRHAQKQNKALFFWDYDKYYLNLKNHEAGFYLRDLIETFPAPQDFVFESGLTLPKKSFKVLNIPTLVGQAKTIPLTLAQLPLGWKENPVETALVLADESMLLPALSSLPADIPNVNISMGYPVKETKVFSFVASLIDLHKNKNDKRDNPGRIFYHADVIQLLQNGLLDRFNQQTEGFIQKVIKQNQVYIDTSPLDSTNEFFALLFQKEIDAREFIVYLKIMLNKIAELFYDEDTNPARIEREACVRLLLQLNRLGDLLTHTPVIFNFSSLNRLLTKIFEKASIPFSGEPIEGLQIMGVLETRNLDFENLIILSLNEGVFPKTGHAPSYIPYSLRKAYGLPTLEHQDAIFAYYFYRLIQRAENITLVYSSSETGSKGAEPSRFIHQLLYENSFSVSSQNLNYKLVPNIIHKVSFQSNNNTLELLKKKYTGDEKQTLSPSAINAYLNCKTQFYLRYVSGLKEPESIQEKIESSTIGLILHKSMQLLYEPYINTLVTSELHKAICADTEKISKAVIQAFTNEYLGEENLSDITNEMALQGKNILYKEIIQRLVLSILRYDQQQVPFTLRELEYKVQMPFGTSSGFELSIGGTIDRVDLCEGNIRIIDYKTGKIKNSFQSIESLFTEKPSTRNANAFQTLLYSMAFKSNNKDYPVVPFLYYLKGLNKKNYDGRLAYGEQRKKQTIDSFSSVEEEFKTRLKQTLDEIFSEKSSFYQTDDIKFCTYCMYKNICHR